MRSPARGLSIAAQQTVEIAKALSLNTRVLIMDEPTAALSAHEVTQLFKLVRALRAQGVAILFIGHRMEEVFEIADRITIFRDGRLISSAPRSEVTTESAIRDMVGRELSAFFSKESARSQDVLISVSGLGRTGVFSDISFEIHRGEVFGFAGLVGARRTDVGLALFGIEPADAGEIRLEGQVRRIRSPEQAIALGIVYVPEDRRNHGLIMPMSLSANISLPTLKRYLAALGLIRRAEEQKMAESFRKQLSIRAQSVLSKPANCREAISRRSC